MGCGEGSRPRFWLSPRPGGRSWRGPERPPHPRTRTDQVLTCLLPRGSLGPGVLAKPGPGLPGCRLLQREAWQEGGREEWGVGAAATTPAPPLSTARIRHRRRDAGLGAEVRAVGRQARGHRVGGLHNPERKFTVSTLTVTCCRGGERGGPGGA